MPHIEIKNLKVSYINESIETLVLDDVNVSFINEKIAAVIGPSGCGKSTLIRTICGFLNYQGEIVVDGVDYSLLDFKERNISYVDQFVTLNPNLDVYNNIAAPLIFNKVKRMEIDKRVKEVASKLGISRFLSLFPTQLSAGQCQLSLLAKSLVKKPKLLLLDEAFSSLDEESKSRFISTVKEQQKENSLTVIFISHKYEEIYQFADYVVTMEKGKIEKIIDRNEKSFNYLKEIMENSKGILYE